MNSFFQDEYINTKLLQRLIKEVRQEQLSKTIQEIDYFCEVQHQMAKTKRFDFTPSQNKELDFIKKFNNARKHDMQA